MKPPNRVVYRFWHRLSPRGRVGYIGKDTYWPSRSSPKSRAKEKCDGKFHRALKKYSFDSWKIDVLEKGIKSGDELIRREIFWIAYFNSKLKGYNCTDGGEGASGHRHSKVSLIKMKRAQNNRSLLWRKRISDALKRRSPALRKQAADARRGQKWSKAARKRMSRARKGKTILSAAWKQHISEGLKNSPLSKLARKKVGLLLKGRILSKAWKKRISESKKGHLVSRKTRIKISNALVGRHPTKEARKHLSIAMKKRWAKAKKRKKAPCS